MVLGPGQGCQKEKLQNIERQLPLDDLDVADNRFFGVGGEAKNVAGIGNRAVVPPFLQHLAVFGDLVLPFLRSDQIVWIYVLEPDENSAYACFGRFLNEVRNLVTECIDLDGKTETGELGLAQMDEAIEQQFPISIAREIVIGNEESLDALRMILAHDLFEVVGRAEAAFAALHIDDGTERTLVGTAATEVDAGKRTRSTSHVLARQKRGRLSSQCRQFVHIVVKRFECTVPRVC